jgi:pimeloyl-ACP methyl ester carboxylesterase
MSLPGFEDARHAVGAASYFVAQGGGGPLVLLLHGFPAPDVWRAWAEDVTAARVPGGHFIPEEAASEAGDLLGAFLAA